MQRAELAWVLTSPTSGLAALMALSVGVTLLSGCDDTTAPPPIELPLEESHPEPASAEVEAPASGYTAIEVADPGRVVGHVRFTGPRPRLAPMEVDHQMQACGSSQPSPVLTIGQGGGLADVVVSVEDVTSGRELPERAAPPVVDQIHCRYVPHVLALALGERVIFRNGDPVLHNVRAEWTDGTLWFNVGQPRSGDASAHVADRTGVARLLCDAGHPWMLAWVHVFDHPYFAVTGDDGAFEIVGLPPGEHRVRFWHASWEVIGTASGRPTHGEPVVIERTVAVPPNGEVVVDVTFPPAAEPTLADAPPG